MKTAILFDLDGTLLDTAQDFAFAINQLLVARNKPQLSYDEFRKQVHGESTAMIAFAFDMEETHPEFATLRQRFLETYHQNCTQRTCFFPGITTVLNYLDTQGIPWGIVTNKPSWLTTPVATHFDLHQRAKCIISGDTLLTKKPNPEPLWYACQLIGTLPDDTIYVGDLETDTIAARAAGMKSIAVTYGYHAPLSNPQDWNADCIAQTPLDIVRFTQALAHDLNHIAR